jgi:hypothetical protein
MTLLSDLKQIILEKIPYFPYVACGTYRMRLLCVLCGFLLINCGPSKELLVAGRVYEFPDRRSVPEPPAKEPDPDYDFVDKTVLVQMESFFDFPRTFRWMTGNPKQANNIDAFDEVGNSSWFTNRVRTITLEEALRGPDTVDGPEMTHPWEVAGVKTQGVTPGFRIKDSRGDLYLLKFDPPAFPELATAAEIISTKLVHAAGFNTPENYLVFFTEEQLVIKDEITLVDEFGNERILTPEDVMSVLERVTRTSDGKFRAVASKSLSGGLVGPFSYVSRRKTDLNDVFRHEHRRELRGLQPLAAFINHNDIRRINSLDIYMLEGYVKHYLIDFGSTLGSVNFRSEGFEYIIDFGTITKAALSGGAYKRPWRRYNQESNFTSIGYFGVDGFNPEKWRPSYPNMAFQRISNRDGFWGAKLVMSITDEMIHGIVAQAKYSDPRAVDYMIATLIKRRDIIGRYWYGKVSPLDRYSIIPSDAGQQITFVDLAVEIGFEQRQETSYRTHQLVYNNFGGRDKKLLNSKNNGISHTTDGTTTTMTLSPELLGKIDALCRDKETPGDRLFYLKIDTHRTSKNWKKSVRLHLHYVNRAEGFVLAGVERLD